MNASSMRCVQSLPQISGAADSTRWRRADGGSRVSRFRRSENSRMKLVRRLSSQKYGCCSA